MDTVKLINDLNGIKAGTELAYDEQDGMWKTVITDEDVHDDDIVYTKTSRIAISDDRLNDYPHFFERIPDEGEKAQDPADEIYQRYSKLIDDLFDSLEQELKEL